MDWQSIASALQEVGDGALLHREASLLFMKSLKSREDQGLAYIHPVNWGYKKALINIPPVVDSIQDKLIEIEGLEHAHGDSEGSVLIRNEDSLVFDSVNCYAIARNIIDMFELDDSFSWEWGSFQKLLIVPHSNIQNATYLRKERRIKFGEFSGSFLCRIPQVVAHEVGHAILDSILPGLYRFKVGEHAAVHEGFADVTSILFISIFCWDQLNVNSDVSNLRDIQQLSSTGTSCGVSDHPVRDANNSYSLCDIRNRDSPNSLDILTEVFTGFFFDLLVGISSYTRSLPAAGRTVASILITAVQSAPDPPTISDIAVRVNKIAEGMQTDYDISSLVNEISTRRGFDL
eukprot:TRINITY_DN16043_c0_g1_i1.p1 TRINITY_DN16043_c0_g1~~TRINITY_DN16043_c0_g1_i1.p1  ORF type:complete len:346 (+),score=35.52 TRINITY_DN16043_c0_g1_i1:51-1088(+)